MSDEPYSAPNPPNEISDPDLWSQIEAESKNFEATTKYLGNTVELVQDFQDAYKSLAAFVVLPDGGEATERAKVAMIALHLLLKSRHHLLIGSLTLLRGYRGNSLLFLRGAIEAVAFAAKIKANSGLVDYWLNAGDSEEAYMEYKNKFTKLFPKSDPALQELYETYHRCSQMIHNSLYSMAGSFSYPDSSANAPQIRFNLFDLPPDHGIASSLYFILDTHKRILKKFALVLADNIKENVRIWELRFNSVEAKLDLHREKWKKVVPDPRSRPPIRPTLIG